MIIKIKNRAGTEVLNRIDDYEGLRFETDRIGGFTTAEFSLKRNALRRYNDLLVYNQIVLEQGSNIVWEGYISEPGRTSPVEMIIPCLGWIGRLTETEITADQPSQKMSAFITTMLADSDVSPFISAGTIGTTDYNAPPATDNVPPGKFYSDMLADYNKWNDWRYGVSEGQKFYFNAPQTTAKWIVLSKDAPGFQINESPANFWNRVVYSYHTSDTDVFYDYVEDTDSYNEYGRWVTKIIEIPGIVSGAVQAEVFANIYLSHGSTMTVMGQIITNTVYDAATRKSVPIWKVRGGDVVKIQDFLTPEAIIGNVVDEITTFEIKTTQYDYPTKLLTITPKDWDSGLEATFARLDSKK